jgi:hypothetical protein
MSILFTISVACAVSAAALPFFFRLFSPAPASRR